MTVRRGDLVISICRDGIIESGDNLDIKNRVRGLRNILQIVPDGSHVRRGDLLVRLDGTSLREALAAERAALAKSEAAVIRSRRSWQVARIAVDEYGEGIYEQQRLQLQSGILEAQRRLTKAEHNLLQVQLMYQKGFISPPHVKQQELAVEMAQGELRTAKLKKEILEGFTQVKVLAELTSKRDAWAARLKSDEAVVRRQTEKIARLEADLANCDVHAARDGMVVYAESTAGPKAQASPMYQGAPVRQYQTLVRIAKAERMQARVLVPQTMLGQLRRGQRAYLRVLDQELRGKVASVADRPEPTLPAGENIKQFAVVIAFDGRGEGLKPGLTAEAEILVDHRKDGLAIPLLCVVEESGKSHVRVKDWGRVTTREVVLGMANDALVEVIGGLEEGEKVILNPQGTSRPAGDG